MNTLRRILSGMLIAGGVVSCGTPPPIVELTMEVSRTAGVLHIEGTTDLRDGALLGYELRHEHMNFDPETPMDMLFQEGTATVADGRFAVEADISNFEPGEIEVWVAFQMDFLNSDLQQPARIIRQFGEHGELLEGPDVTDLGDDGRRVELSEIVHW